MHFTEAAWRISTPLFTTGCTVTSTRLVRASAQTRAVAAAGGSCHLSQSTNFWNDANRFASNFVSIRGLSPCFQHTCCVQNSVFGEGTYLTSDLSMALLYSPHSSGWQESLLGPLLSCVALCEVVDHPDVKCQVKKKGAAPRSRTPGIKTLKRKPDSRRTFSDSEAVDRQRSRAKNSEGGEVPHKYFVVTNNQLLRVKYLLLYSQRRHLSR